jgi:hypothetical protein
MSWNPYAREEGIRFRMELFEDGGDIETINEQSGTPGTVGM